MQNERKSIFSLTKFDEKKIYSKVNRIKCRAPLIYFESITTNDNDDDDDDDETIKKMYKMIEH